MIEKHFPFQVTFRGVHGSRTFDSPEELNHWLLGESEAYEALTEAKLARNEEPISGLLAQVHATKTFPNLLQQAINHAENKDEAQVDSHIANLRKRLGHAYQTRGIPPGSSAEVVALRPYMANDTLAALAALHCLSDPQNPGQIPALTLNDAAYARGIGLASFIRFQLFSHPDQSETGAKIIDKTASTIQERADRSHQRLTNQINDAEATLARLKGAYDNSDKDYKELKQKLADSVDGCIENAKNEIIAFKSSYQAEIALKEPVTFWQEKGKQHARSAMWFSIAAIGTAAVSGCVAVTQLPALLQVAPNSPPPYYGLAISVAVSTLVLWLLRVLVRSYLGQSHLKADADERVAMVKTYLALMESGKAPAENLGPVVSALFRPASDGLVKDDSMPLSVAELLTKPPR